MIEKLEKVKDKELTKDQREELGPKLFDAAVSEGGDVGMKAIDILISKNMSYYAYENSEKLTDLTDHFDDLSYRKLSLDLISYLYEEHGVFDELYIVLEEAIAVPDEITREETGFEGDYIWVSDESRVREVIEEQYDSEIDMMHDDRRFVLRDGRKGNINTYPGFSKVELHEKTQRLSVRTRSSSTELYLDCLDIAGSIIRSAKDQVSASVIDQLISSVDTYTGQLLSVIIELVVDISDTLSDEQQEQFEQNIIRLINSSYVEDSFVRQFVSYVITVRGDVVLEEDVFNTVVSEYQIDPDNPPLYVADDMVVQAFVSIGHLRGLSQYKLLLVKLGFTKVI